MGPHARFPAENTQRYRGNVIFASFQTFVKTQRHRGNVFLASFRERFTTPNHAQKKRLPLLEQRSTASKPFMICVLFGTVLARIWTNQGAGSKLYRTNDPSGSANLVRAGPPDPASAAPTANPYLVKLTIMLEIYHPLPLKILSKIL